MITEWNLELRTWMESVALVAGFDVSGVTSTETVVDDERFALWVDAGRAGEMEWLKRRNHEGVLVRSGVRVALPWARSVVVCSMNYNVAAPRSIDSADRGAGWIGRYAWSGRRVEGEVRAVDYHDDLLARLKVIEAALQERAPCETRCYVDTGPLVERGAAAKAGIGWVGKNTCVLREGMGSWMLMGVIVTSLPVRQEDGTARLAPDRCGSCTRCLDACPTEALVAPREMDARLCIAYLTIEKKGAIPEELREKMGRQVFGCDICQDVCPWNRKAPVAVKAGLNTREELVNPALDWLASLDAAGFRRLFKGSPLERTGRKRLHRNVAIAMGNSGEQRFVPQLERWAGEEDAVLAESAGWALERLQSVQAATAFERGSGTDAPIMESDHHDC